MSFAEATAALDGAIAQDAAPQPLPAPATPEQAPVAPTTPEGTPTPQVQPTPVPQPRDEFGRFAMPTTPEPAQPTADTFDGQFNPDLLPDELRPGWRQLQASYTQKTQELAEQRKQFEGMDPAVAREAVELYTALQDPNYLVQFHSQLSDALQARGLTQAQAEAVATEQTAQAAGQQSVNVNDQLAALRQDPELAPVADAYSSLRTELDGLKSQLEQERAQQEMAQMQMALAGELMRQEAVLRQHNYTDADIGRVHELAAFHDGNLLQAAESLSAIRQEAVSAYLAQKQGVDPAVGPVAGQTSPAVAPAPLETTEQGHAAALQYLKAAGLEDFAG